MNYFELDEQILIPANKICDMYIDPDNNKKLVLWLDGGQVQNITSPSDEDAKVYYKRIRELIKQL